MPKGMRSALTDWVYIGSLQAQAKQQVQAGFATERSIRRLGMNKDLAGIGDRPSSSQVGQQGISDGRDQRQDGLETGLGMPHRKSVGAPVHIGQQQMGDLSGPQSVGGKHHEDRVVAQTLGRVVLTSRSKNGAYLFGYQERGHRLTRVEGWRDDADREVQCSAPCDMKEPEEATHLLRHIFARNPAQRRTSRLNLRTAVDRA